MAEITTAAELEALPVGVVLLDRGQFPVWRETHFGWRTANGGTRVESDLIILDGAPLTVLYRPDRPAQPTVKPSVDEVAGALLSVRAEVFAQRGVPRPPVEPPDEREWESARIYARAVHALLPGRTEQEVIDSFLTRLGEAVAQFSGDQRLTALAAAIRAGEQ